MSTEQVTAPTQMTTEFVPKIVHIYETCSDYVPAGARALCGYVKRTNNQTASRDAHKCLVCVDLNGDHPVEW